ncbi:MAG: hypothetical protein HZB99_02850 [Candidatus Harrisonbacteria bacterium]|nr:hypothetical protein [Candidatus Harrisonbacteria bacterium]
MNINVSKLVSGVLASLDQRQREVLEGRYGLKDGEVRTLAEIGEKNSITRERVRQIEAGALQEVRVLLAKTDGSFVNLVKTHLKNIGGVRREALLLTDLKMMVGDPNTQYLGNKVRFLLEVAGDPKFVSEGNDNYSYWYLSGDDQKKATGFVAKLVKLMEVKKGEVVTHGNIDLLLKDATGPHNLKDLVALNFISISKDFHVNEFGDFGLSHWPEVNPKTVRDWAHIVLKKERKPLHFQDIAKLINRIRKDSRKLAHPQTVHNELIKDQRFVLVGRGMYGLQEFGLMPGTAKEVMGRILKQHGPLSPKELLGLVLKERMLKKNTVMINLQNRKFFKRLEDGKYTVLV